MKKRANVLKVTFFYFNNHLPNKETNEKCLEKQRNQTKNRKTSPQQGNQRKLLRKTSPQQGNQRKASLDLAATRLVKILKKILHINFMEVIFPNEKEKLKSIQVK